MKNCTLNIAKTIAKTNKLENLKKALKNIGVKAEIIDDAVIVEVGKGKTGGSFYQPTRTIQVANEIQSTAKMRTGWIISTKGRVNLYLRKLWAERGVDNQVIVRPI